MTTVPPDCIIEVPKALPPLVGKPDPGTRIYRTEGGREECVEWFEAIMAACQPDFLVSPGGVCMFAPVSRAAVHKAMKEGRLTAFLFHEVEERRYLFGTKRAHRRNAFIYIPVLESKVWAEQLHRLRPQIAELEGPQPDWHDGNIGEGPKEFRKSRPRIRGGEKK